MMNEAAIRAAKLDKDEIQIDDINESIDKIQIGAERKGKRFSDKSKKLVAY